MSLKRNIAILGLGLILLAVLFFLIRQPQDTTLLIFGTGLFLVTAAAVYSALHGHPVISAIAGLIVAVLMVEILLAPPIVGPPPAPCATSCPAFASWDQPQAQSTNMNVTGGRGSYVISIIGSGTIVFRVTIRNFGEQDMTGLSLRWVNARDNSVWTSKDASDSNPQMTAVVTAVHANFVNSGILDGKAVTFNLGNVSSGLNTRDFEFRIDTNLLVSAPQIPQSLLGHFYIDGGLNSDILTMNAGPTQPQPPS